MKSPVVIVTGAGRGIGRAICECFVREGATVVAAARSRDQLLETQQRVAALPGRCIVRATDVTAVEQLRGLIEFTEREFSRIDILVNNAGATSVGPVKELSTIDFETLLRVNVAAVFYACKFVWPIMERNGGGVIVNISSLAAADPFPGLGTYGATKAWVNAFTAGMAAEGRPAGIRAFCVGPGAVETDMLRSIFPDFPAENTLAPPDIAEAVHTLTQPSMSHASGQTFYIRK